MKEQNSYYAFISYNSADEKWAKWLQHSLEYYHIPSALCKEYPELPQKIRPVFWYKKDLSGTKLKNALNNELSCSKYLIVICSPDSAKAGWVNDEVVAFIEQGKGDRIIPFIVAGTPHAKNPEEECFPPALHNLPRDEEIRGIDVHRKEGKSHALVDVIATMFGVRFDVLWQRHERRRKKIRNIWIAITSVFLLCILGFYDYNRTKVEYYADFVDRWGVAEGIIPLDDDQVSHRHHSYKFEYIRVPFGEKDFYSWRLKRVSLVNSKGVISNYTPDHHAFFYPIQEFEYADGYVTDIINRDTYKRIVMRYSVKDDYGHNVACLVDMEGKEKRQGSAYLDASTTSMIPDVNSNSTKSKIKRFHYTRNERGYIMKITYHANDGDDIEETAIGDNNNIFGKLFDLDSLGRVIKVSYINNENNLMTDKFGVGHIRYTYSKYSGTETTEFLGEDLQLTNNEEKYAKVNSKFDEYGNIIEESYYGLDNMPCYNNDNIHRLIISYDNNGNTSEIRLYDLNGNLSYCKDSYAILKSSYDSKGRCVEFAFYDINEKACYSKDNYSIARIKYNSNDCAVEQSVFDTNGLPCVEKYYGVHKICRNYNEFNYLLEESLYDESDELNVSPMYHFAKQTYEYNDYHQLISIKNFNEFGVPCNHKNNYSEQYLTYDKRGNIENLSFCDVYGNPCYSDEGAACFVYKYDTYGNMIYLRCLDGKNQPVFSKYNYTGWRAKYNNKGLLTEQIYLNEKDSLCLSNQWYAIARFKYDSQGNTIEESYYNADSLPCYTKNGYYSIARFEYDNQNNITKKTFMDTVGNPIVRAGGYACVSYKYNKYRKIIEEAYFDTQNNPCLAEQAYHKRVFSYNDKGLLVSETFYSINNDRCSVNGVSKILNEYDEKGNLIRRTNFDERDQKCLSTFNICSFTQKFDVQGRLTEVCNFDCYGKPIMAIDNTEANKTNRGTRSICRQVVEYDSLGNPIKILYYDETGNLSVRNGWAKEEHIYDLLNRIVESKFYNEKGELMGGNFSKPIEKYEYNNLGQATLLQLVEEDGSIFVNINMKCEKNNIVELSFTNKEGKLQELSVLGVNTGTPYAIGRFTFNEKGLLLKKSHYDKNGELFNGEIGYAYVVNDYDKQGRIIRQELYDKDGNIAESTVGKWSVLINNYDEKDNLIEQSYYAKNGALAQTPWNWSRRLQKYDELGKCIEDIYYYANGRIETYDPLNKKNIVNKDVDLKESLELIKLSVENYGQMYEKGFRGEYFVLEFNDWNMYEGLDAFVEELMKGKNKLKKMVLLRQGKNVNIIEYVFSSEPLNARIMDWKPYDNGDEIYKEICESYNKWKTNK